MDPDPSQDISRAAARPEGETPPLLSDPRYRGLYLCGLRVTWPGRSADSIYRGGEEDLDTIYPEEISAALTEMEECQEELANLAPLSKLSPEKLAKRASLSQNLDKLTRLFKIHERRVRGGHLALAERLGEGWKDYLYSLGSLLFLIETLEESLSSALSQVEGARKPSERDKRALSEALSAAREKLQELDSLNILSSQSRSFPSPDSASQEKDPSLEEASWPGLPPSSPSASQEKDPFLEEASWPEFPPSGKIAPPPELSASPKKGPCKEKPPSLSSLALLANEALEALAKERILSLEKLLSCESKLFLWRSEGLQKAPFASYEPLPVPGLPQAPQTPKDRDYPKERPANKRLWIMAVLTLLMALATLAVTLAGPGDPPEPFRLHVYNGLGATVLIEAGQSAQELIAGGAASMDIDPETRLRVSAKTPENLIESFEGTAASLSGLGSLSGQALPSEYRALLYNVGGGAPLIEWEAIYDRKESDSPPKENRLGAPTFVLTKADYVLAQPPKTLKVKGSDRRKTVLSALGNASPDRMLAAAPEEDRGAIIEAQARWSSPSSLFTPVWLNKLARESEHALETLSARLEDYPLDPLTNDLFLSLAPKAEAEAWCLSLGELIKNSSPKESGQLDISDIGDKSFLMALCLSDIEKKEALEELLLSHPDHPWINRSGGFEHFRRGDYQKALIRLETALAAEPSAMMADLTTLARLRFFHGLSLADLASDLGPLDASLARLPRRAPVSEDYGLFPIESELDVEDAAFSLLESGRLDDALSLTGGGPLADKLVILAAATPGASRSLIERALSIPKERVLAARVPWTYLGLSLREAKRAKLASSSPGQGAAGQLGSAQEPAVQDESSQERAAQERASQERASQGSDTQESDAQERAAQESASNRAAVQDALSRMSPNQAAAFEAVIEEASKDRNGPAREAAEAIIGGRADLLPPLYQGYDPWFQGQVCLAAWLAMGEEAPSDCPAKAAGFLFPGERPPLGRSSPPQAAAP